MMNEDAKQRELEKAMALPPPETRHPLNTQEKRIIMEDETESPTLANSEEAEGRVTRARRSRAALPGPEMETTVAPLTPSSAAGTTLYEVQEGTSASTAPAHEVQGGTASPTL